MANAYKCDRCGILYEKYKNQGTSEFFNIARNPCTTGNCLDLCQNCNTELQEWVACNCTDEDKKISYEQALDGMKSEYPTGVELDAFLEYKRDKKGGGKEIRSFRVKEVTDDNS